MKQSSDEFISVTSFRLVISNGHFCRQLTRVTQDFVSDHPLARNLRCHIGVLFQKLLPLPKHIVHTLSTANRGFGEREV